MSICCACKKRKSSSSTATFHVFPRDRNQSKKWCKAVGLNGPPTPSARVCSEHFTEQDYTKGCDGVSKGKLLLPTAVPSQNLESRTEDNNAPPAKVPRPTPTISPKIQELEEILQQNADPPSINFSHDPDALTITIRYQPIPQPSDSRAKRVCTRCNAILRIIDYGTHAKSCVGGKLKPFQCGTCQSCYETIKELRLHKCEPHQEPDDKAERREQLELLTQAITGREYDSDSDEMDVVGEEEVQPNKRCVECERLIPVSRMQVHYRKFHENCANAPFRCRLCESQFGFCEDLSKHLRSHTAKQLRSLRNRKPDGIPFDSDGKTCYECYLCGNVFGTEESVRVHQGTHLGDNIRCPVCGRNCESKSDFLKHLASHQ
uniref:Zinc finger protein 62 homolog n=1 Tax=Culex pipiens TaxID=7175 RepID=A0A8D8JZE6_CULPI